MSNEMLVEIIKNGADRNGQHMLQLYNQNMGLLYRTCHMLQIPKDLEEEIKQEFFLWLSDAVRTFDSTYESKFSTFLMQSLRCRMIRFLEEQTCCKIPSYRHDKIREYKREKQHLMQIMNREPSPKEMSSFMGISLDELFQIESDIKKGTVNSLNEKTAEGTEIQDLIKDNNNPIEELEDRLDIEYRNNTLWRFVLNDNELTKESVVAYYNGEYRANNKANVRNELYKAIKHIRQNGKQLKILAELSNYDNYNCCRQKSVYAFQGSNSSIVEDLVFRKLESEEQFL